MNHRDGNRACAALLTWWYSDGMVVLLSGRKRYGDAPETEQKRVKMPKTYI